MFGARTGCFYLVGDERTSAKCEWFCVQKINIHQEFQEDKISSQSQFDDGHSIVVIEFWAEFNKDNAFKEWEKIQSVEYYRCDVAKSPKSKKEFRIRMAPTIIIFVDGVKVETFKAGLDLLCPVELPELKQAIQQAQKSSQF